MRIKSSFAVFGVLAVCLFGAVSATIVVPATAGAQDPEEEVPPGNPVIGSERPGDIEPENDTNYGLWALLAACLIGAGFLLVRIERWEGRRANRGARDGSG